jgi:hypothetical protein
MDKKKHYLQGFITHAENLKTNNRFFDLLIKNNRLEIIYTPFSGNARADICTTNGEIIYTTCVNALSTIIYTDTFMQGHYELWLIDGDVLLKKSFTIPGK